MTSPFRTAVAAAALAAGLAGSATACGWSSPARLAAVDVFDRTAGTALAVHEKDGQAWVVGVPGHEYAVRIRNCTAGRILAVTSVDGVNVVTGETAAPDQSGYVVEPWASVEITGWRKSLARTAVFSFTDHAQSYAARTGRPVDVGVIGVAVFAEKVPATRPRQKIASAEADARSAPAPAAQSAPESPGPGATAREPKRETVDAAAERAAGSAPYASLGTGHGRSEASPAQRTAFERAGPDPAQVVAIRYDRYENLVALGIVPPQHLARRPPQPFPGLRFAPDPPR